MSANNGPPKAMSVSAIRHHLKNNTVILVGSNGLMLVARLVSTIILTRILDPSAFGIIAILSIVPVVLTLISDVGFYPYVVRAKGYADRQFLDEVWSLRLVRSFLTGAAMFALSSPIAAFVGEPDLSLPLKVTALLPILDGLASMTFATAAKDGKIFELSLVDVITATVNVTAMIAFSLLLKSFWGIVFGGLVSTTLKTTLSYLLFKGSQRRWRFSVERMKSIWAFGRFIMPSSMMTLMIGQIDKIIFAPMLGAAEFGYYGLASNLGAAPNSLTAPYSARILYPAFSRAQARNPGNWSADYYAIGAKPRAALMVCFGMFIALPQSIVTALYDDRYFAVIYYLQVLAICSLLIATINFANDALIAAGHVRATLKINTVRLVSLVIFGVSLYYGGGPKAMVAALALSLLAAQIFAGFSLAKANIFNWVQELRLAAFVVLGFGFGWGLNFVLMRFLS